MGRRSRLPGSLATALRVLALILAFQTDGTLHTLIDLAAGDVPGCSEPCEDGDDERCPPACPTCDCEHGVRPALPAVPAPESAALPAMERERVPFEPRPVVAPDLDGPFHPPRA